ncbi:LemA family protein [Phytohabitans rumicis]|uniref:LemA family protein n=1 Tax=Phytohabitans rumicis TaxID=1076125 RepID=UPI003FCD3A21
MSGGVVLGIVGGLFCLLAVVVIGWGIVAYNRLVRQRNQVRASWAQIDVQLKRRHDLIPNLVETVKGYATHERGTLDAVVVARNGAVTAAHAPGVGDRAAAEDILSQALGRLFALAEAYPDLKANQNFAALQGSWPTPRTRSRTPGSSTTALCRRSTPACSRCPRTSSRAWAASRRWSTSRPPAANAARSRSASSRRGERWTGARCWTSRWRPPLSAAGSAGTAWRGWSPGRPARGRSPPAPTSVRSRRRW